MGAVPTADEIMEAIHESGYLMEQEVATQLEKLGFHVRTNAPFEDADEAKSREIDVVAIKRVATDDSAKLSAFVELIVECKNSSNPLVFIARPKNIADKRSAPDEFLFPYNYTMRKDLGGGRGMTREVSAFHHLGFDAAYREYQHIWKAVQFCRIDRKGAGWHANHGGLYDAIFYPMAKALVARKKEVPSPSRSDDWRYFWFFFPIVVTSGELFLIDSTEQNLVPRPVNQVSFRRELKSGKLSGAFTLTFVRQQFLSEFLASVVDPVGELASELIRDRLPFLKATDLRWMD